MAMNDPFRIVHNHAIVTMSYPGGQHIDGIVIIPVQRGSIVCAIRTIAVRCSRCSHPCSIMDELLSDSTVCPAHSTVVERFIVERCLCLARSPSSSVQR